METNIGHLSIPEKAPYINGEQFTGVSKRKVTEPAMYEDFLKKVAMYDSAEYLFNYYDGYADFFKANPDFANWYPKEHWKELFYAAKNGFYSADVPAECIYVIKKLYKEFDIPNLIFRRVPASMLNSWFEEGFLRSGYTLRDVVCTFCIPTYRPFDSTTNKIVHKQFTEIYISETDMVAAVPNKLGEILSHDTIDKITPAPYGLCVDGTYIRTLAGYHGAVNSVYDLRRLY